MKYIPEWRCLQYSCPIAQNEKTIEDYYHRIDRNELPVVRGHILTEEDLKIRKHILNLMCQFTTSWDTKERFFVEIPEILSQLHEMETDGLISIENNTLTVTEKGKPFVRNICMAFDLRMKRKAPQTQLFSMTV